MTPEIEQARTAAQSASQAYGQTAAEEPTISDVLKQKVIEAYNSSQDIVKPLDVATQTYLGAPQAGREKYQDIFNPFQRENLVSQYVGNEALPMLSLSSILGQRFGRYDDLIGAGTNAFRAQVLAQQAKAEQARQLYSDLLKEYELSQPDTQVIEAGGRKLLVNSRTGEIIKDLGYSGSGGGGEPFPSFNWPGGKEVTPTGNQWEDITEVDTTPTWEDPLKKLQQQQELEKLIPWGSVNLGGIKPA